MKQVMNRINRLFREKAGNVLSIYFTAGFPSLHSTASIIRSLAAAGADMIEIGIPFSDPMADGPVIQQSNDRALRNGMSLAGLFDQLRDIRRDVDIPLLLMGYLNPVMQYGMERFCEACARTGIDGVILPDMPPEVFAGAASQLYGMAAGQSANKTLPLQEGDPFVAGASLSLQELFKYHGLYNIFLISPQTGAERIRMIDGMSGGFIYMVSASSTTGARGQFTGEQEAYFRRIRDMQLDHPRLIGFGISDHQSFAAACEHAEGAIIGSAFVRMLSESGGSEQHITDFISEIRQGSGVW